MFQKKITDLLNLLNINVKNNSDLLFLELLKGYEQKGLDDNKLFSFYLKPLKFLHPKKLFFLHQKCQEFENKISEKVKILFFLKYDFKNNATSYKKYMNNLFHYLIWMVDHFCKIKISSKNVTMQCNTFNFDLTNQQELKCILKHETDIINLLAIFGYEDFKFNHFYKNETKLLIDENLNSLNQKTFQSNSQPIKTNTNSYCPANLSVIKEIFCEKGTFKFKGEVFDFSFRQSRNRLDYVEIYVTDWDTSVKIMAYRKINELKKILELNQWYLFEVNCAKGRSYSKYDIMFCDGKISHSLKNIVRCDPLYSRETSFSHKPSNEMSMHSKMTVQDGVVFASDIIDEAYKLNFKSLAILDLNSLQSLPEIANHSVIKNKKIKPLYGCQFNKIKDFDTSCVLQSADERCLKDLKFCVFDLETTGLYANFCDLIEFACCNFSLDNVNSPHQESFLINSTENIPEFIQNKTHINKNLLNQKGILPKDAAKRISDLIKGKVLVAHNANFDLSFLNAFLMKHGYDKVTNPVVDTLWLSRYLIPDLKSYTLQYLSTKFKIEYIEQEAHRADYDTYVLYQLFIFNMLKNLLLNWENLSLRELGGLNNQHLQAFNFGYRTSVIAKNLLGYQALNELVSYSHTKSIYVRFSKQNVGVPMLNEKELFKKTKDLLVGSHCTNGEVFNAVLTKTDKEIVKIIQKYDYVEIPDTDLLSFFLYRKHFHSQDVLQKLILKIIDYCKLAHVPYIAVSDGYFIHPWQKQMREPFIFTEGLRGKKHYLFDYAIKAKLDVNNANFDAEYVTKLKNSLPNAYLKTRFDHEKNFQFVKDKSDLKNLIYENSEKLVTSVDFFDPLVRDLHPPIIDNALNSIKEKVQKSFEIKYHNSQNRVFHERLTKEWTMIEKHHYEVIYYLCSELTKQSVNSGYIVGSRGSVGSSFIAHLLDITEVNPLPPHYYCAQCDFVEFTDPIIYKCGYDLPNKLCNKCQITLKCDGHNIPFETFIGLNGDKVPDIDLNFSGEYQQNAHNYIKELVGEDKVFRAGTISTYAEKMAAALTLNYLELLHVNDNYLTKAHWKLLQKYVLGAKRTSGQHPGGLIVIPQNDQIYQYSAVNFPSDDIKKNWKTTHFSFDVLHDTLLKLDILGHDDPTMLKRMHEATKIDPLKIKFDDPNVLNLFFGKTSGFYIKKNPIKHCPTAIGLPEFGTKLARQMLFETEPKTFADLVKISGLSHGRNVWNNNFRDLVYVNKTKLLNDIFGCRDDIMLSLIDYGVDKSSAFYIMESVRKGRQIPDKYNDILVTKNVDEWFINACNKINYLFPKAHATAYVIMAYRIAYYKYYYPLEFYAANLSVRFSNFDYQKLISNDIDTLYNHYLAYNKISFGKPKNAELASLMEALCELNARNIKILPIDLNKSAATSFIVDTECQALIPPLVALDALGNTAASNIVNVRDQKLFFSIEDFYNRVKINSKQKSELEKNNLLNFKD